LYQVNIVSVLSESLELNGFVKSTLILTSNLLPRLEILVLAPLGIFSWPPTLFSFFSGGKPFPRHTALYCIVGQKAQCFLKVTKIKTSPLYFSD